MTEDLGVTIRAVHYETQWLNVLFVDASLGYCGHIMIHSIEISLNEAGILQMLFPNIDSSLSFSKTAAISFFDPKYLHQFRKAIEDFLKECPPFLTILKRRLDNELT